MNPTDTAQGVNLQGGRTLPDVAAATAGMDPDEVAALLRRLRRVEGQVGGLVRMIESGRDCTEVVTQLAAASHALDRIGFLLIASGLRTCRARPDGDASTDDTATALERLFLTLA